MVAWGDSFPFDFTKWNFITHLSQLEADFRIIKYDI